MVLMTSFVYQAESFLRRVEAAVFARNQSTGVPRLQTHWVKDDGQDEDEPPFRPMTPL